MINLGTGAYGRPAYNLKKFYLDYAKDLIDLPTNCAVGSKAFIIENSEVYILNSEKKWIKQVGMSGGEGSKPGGEGEIPWGDMGDSTTPGEDTTPQDPMQ